MPPGDLDCVMDAPRLWVRVGELGDCCCMRCRNLGVDILGGRWWWSGRGVSPEWYSTTSTVVEELTFL